jgi:hypothetical protein
VSGHPLDTLTVIACFLFLVVNTFDWENLAIYVGLSVFSCLFVTKDEWIHSKECVPLENWLHALLFVLHPIILGSAGVLWFLRDLENQASISSAVLQGQVYAGVVVMVYQVGYWCVWKRKNK